MPIKQISHFFICTLIATALNTTCMNHPKEFNPENTKFAFDFHGVIANEPFSVQENPTDILKVFRWDFIPTFNRQLPLLVCALIKQIVWHGFTWEGLRNLCAQYKQKQVVIGMTEVANNVNLLNGTVSIIKELKAEGYELDLASNIDSLFLDDLEKNNKYTYIQEVLALFTHKKSVDYSTVNLKKPTKKPDISYFVDYHQKYNNPKPKQVIFIDDRKENVEASEQTNMIGIHFQNSEQLRNELVNLGALQQNKK